MPETIDLGIGDALQSLAPPKRPAGNYRAQGEEALMKVATIVGLGLGVGIALLFSRAPSAADATAPPAAAPTPLVPEAYIAALSAPAAPIAPATAQARLSPPPVAALAVPAPAAKGPVVPAATVALPAAKAPTAPAQAGLPSSHKFNQYHPNWVIAVH